MKREIPKWGIEVKKALLDKNMSIGQLAEEMGMTRSYINNIINGVFVFPSTQQKICDHLGIPSE